MKSTFNNQNEPLRAGLLYLLLIIIGMYAFVYVFPQIIVNGQISETLGNIQQKEYLFRLGIASVVVMNIISIWLAFTLKKLFSPIQQNRADLMFYLLLVGAAISLLNEVNHYALLTINTGEGALLTQKEGISSLFIEMHNYGAYLAVIFWGLWLFPLAGLIYTLGTRLSKFIAIMLAIAGIGYLIDSFQVFLTNDGLKIVASDFTFVGELLLALWLLFKSRQVKNLATRIDIKPLRNQMFY